MSFLQSYGKVQQKILNIASCDLRCPINREDIIRWSEDKTERVVQSPYWGIGWLLCVVDAMIQNDPESLVRMIQIDGDWITINWKATPSSVSKKYPSLNGSDCWFVVDQPCKTKFQFVRRAVAGNPLLVVGSRGQSTFDLKVDNDNLLVEILTMGFTRLMQEHLFDDDLSAEDPETITKLVYDEMDGDYAIRAVLIFNSVSAINHKYRFEVKTPTGLLEYLQKSPKGTSFVVSSVTNTKKLKSEHCYSISRWDEQAVALRSPWGFDDIVVDYESLMGDLLDIVAFDPNAAAASAAGSAAAGSAAAGSAAARSVESLNEIAPADTSSADTSSADTSSADTKNKPYPREDYVIQYWDIMFSVIMIVYCLMLNGPKYTVGDFGSVDGRLAVILRIMYVPLIFLAGLCVSASVPDRYIPGQHLLLTVVSLLMTGVSFDHLLVCLRPLEWSAVNCTVSTAIYLVMLFFGLRLIDSASHITGMIGFVTVLVVGLVFNHLFGLFGSSLLSIWPHLIVCSLIMSAVVWVSRQK